MARRGALWRDMPINQGETGSLPYFTRRDTRRYGAGNSRGPRSANKRHRLGYSVTSTVRPGTRHSPNGVYGISTADRPQSTLMLRARITLPHLSVSSAINLPKSPGESASTVPPRSARRTFMLGSARAALISLLSLSTISVGVFLGAPTPYHWLDS